MEPLLMVVMLCCVVGAALLSMAEVSIVRVRRSEILVEARSGHPRAETLLELIDDLPVVLNTILAAVLLLQMSAATIGGYLAGRRLGGLGVTIATVALTMILFVYAEAIPKTYAVKDPRSMALRLTPALKVLVVGSKPAMGALIRLANLQSSGSSATLGALTEDELRALARESAEAGQIATDDASLVDRSFEFNDSCAGDVLVPRSQIAAAQVDHEVLDVMTRAIALGHRRLPVYRDDLDDIVGVVRLRDLAAVARSAPRSAVGSIMTDVLRCTATEPIALLLRRMQASGRWLAVVTSEHGETVGLVTVEDLVAELVGEITDDGDQQGLPETNV
ncbi:MAG: CNNM domain-containing protein [Acidimicrobiia bacterium]|nr:CNNM domain-containing protein [Acidimicrobiia bacterium]